MALTAMVTVDAIQLASSSVQSTGVVSIAQGFMDCTRRRVRSGFLVNVPRMRTGRVTG